MRKKQQQLKLAMQKFKTYQKYLRAKAHHRGKQAEEEQATIFIKKNKQDTKYQGGQQS